MRHLITAICAIGALSACQPDQSNTQQTTAQELSPVAASVKQGLSESERLNQWFASKYEEQLLTNPMMLTFLGRKEKYDEFNAMSREEAIKQLEWQKASSLELKNNFDYSKLDPEAKISFDIWQYQTKQALEADEYHKHTYVFTQMSGMQAFLTQFLINYHKVELESDMLAYNKRIGGVATALTNLLEQAKVNAEFGVRAPKFAYQGVIEQSQNVITGQPFDDSDVDSPLWADAKAKVAALVEKESISQAQADTLLASTKAQLLSVYHNAYQSLISWFETDIKNTDEVATGVGKLPNGKAFYDTQLNHNTTTNKTAEEVHQIGLAEVARITQEMKQVKDKVGFEGDLQEFFVFIKQDDQFYYPNDDTGRQGYIDDTETYLDFIKEQLPKYFGILPKADLVVKRVEPFREQDGAAQHYFPGTPDGSRPGVYYAHLSDMRAMPKNEMEAIAYHEGNPGHHMQISIAQELTSVPEFRTQAFFTSYTEGWALYSELLSKEMGAYENDFSDFGRLITEMWRAVRLVVDTGLHSKGWTEQEAIDYFKANTPVAEEAIISEVRRYIVWPGQATAYKIGMLEILKLRAYAMAELGDNFDIKAFHDTVLGGGSLPLSILERRVNDWVASVKENTANAT
ncbi:DUF885 domain-containing protein [Thalassotalea atypica]|uniref:DUF885 domain-containing protein n=1 Tax=Thalassotalea atypica TaxID=2054316 RepID=UPI0025727ACE|nr:DUF885 domain-containing protein [Thalassotalea atypica]